MNISRVDNSSIGIHANPKSNMNFGGLSNLGQNSQKFLSGLSNLSSAKQKVILTVPTLILNPLIDLNNKKVDEETRKASACRSVASALGGSAVGIIVRDGCRRLCQYSIDKGMIFKGMFEKEKSMGKEIYQKAIKNHAGIVGTIAALGVMAFTDFFVDTACINYLYKCLLKVFCPQYLKDKNAKESEMKKIEDDKQKEQNKTKQEVIPKIQEIIDVAEVSADKEKIIGGKS
ncbi:hypothetical protein IJG72_01335 [bacterium]|nr:hypothetical protein [bacterium]